MRRDGRGLLENDIDRLIRYRNYAEELRIISGDRIVPLDHDALHRIAADYDKMASSLEGIIKARKSMARER